MTFGRWLRDTRLDQDMTIRQFAKLVDLSAVTLCKLEGDKYEPGRYALHQLSKGLKKTYQEMREIVRSCEFVDYE
jgi:transcriptional regulator with XRE-family HTH domain